MNRIVVLDFSFKDTSLMLSHNFTHSRITGHMLVPPELNTCMFCSLSSQDTVSRLVTNWRLALNFWSLLLLECWGYAYKLPSPVHVVHMIDPRASWGNYSVNWAVFKVPIHAIAWGCRFKFHKQISKSITFPVFPGHSSSCGSQGGLNIDSTVILTLRLFKMFYQEVEM